MIPPNTAKSVTKKDRRGRSGGARNDDGGREHDRRSRLSAGRGGPRGTGKSRGQRHLRRRGVTQGERRYRDYYLALHEIARAVNSTLNFREVMSRLVETATKAMRAKGCSLRLLDQEKRSLTLLASYGLSDRYLAKGVVEADRSLGEAWGGEPVIVKDATKDKRIQYPEAAKDEGIATMLGVPLKARGEIIGALRIYASTARPFEKDEIQFLTVVGELGTLALQNALLHQRVLEEQKELRFGWSGWFEGG